MLRTDRIPPVCHAEHRSFYRGGRSPFCWPSIKARSAGSKRQPGRLFFGYFLFDCTDAGGRATHGAVAEAKQKKVTRFRVREPDSNNRRGSDTFDNKVDANTQ